MFGHKTNGTIKCTVNGSDIHSLEQHICRVFINTGVVFWNWIVQKRKLRQPNINPKSQTYGIRGNIQRAGIIYKNSQALNGMLPHKNDSLSSYFIVVSRSEKYFFPNRNNIYFLTKCINPVPLHTVFYRHKIYIFIITPIHVSCHFASVVGIFPLYENYSRTYDEIRVIWGTSLSHIFFT